MVDIAGHLGAALIVLSPFWLIRDRRVALTFIASGVPFGLLPDIDLWLKRVFPTVHHHGITHTILFVTLVSVVSAVVVKPILFDYLMGTRWLPTGKIERSIRFAFGAFWIASLSHLFMDMLASPDIKRYQPIEPFWPLYHQPVTIDVIYYGAFLWTWGLLATGIVLNIVLWWSQR
jgi:inner membrane protein